MLIFDFIKDNLVACIAVGGAVVILIVIIIVALIVSKVKKRRMDELEKMVSNVPIMTDDEDVAVADGEVVNGRKGDADFKWLRVACLGEDDSISEEKNKTSEENAMAKETVKKKTTTVKEEPKTKETVKKTSKTVKKEAKPKAEPKAKETVKKATQKTATKATETKAQPKTAVKEESKTKTTKKAVGKWVVRDKGEGEFVSFLHANNGEIILTSEIYSSADSAKKGIATIQKSVASGVFQVYSDKNRNFYFKLKNAKNRFLCVGETYPTRNACLSAVESVKRFIDAPIAEEIEEDVTIIKYVLPKKEKTETKSGYTGKWKIVEIEDMYMAQLYASNGELLLCSESYTTTSSAKSAIDTITSNGIDGNFIIDTDKKGRYFFKLRNAQKATLCIGETYSQLANCQSAIDSVRRFLKTAKLVED